MVRFVKDQPDAYVYSSFGSRIFVAGFFIFLLYFVIGIGTYLYAKEIMTWYTNFLGEDISAVSGTPVIGDLVNAIIFICALFLPLNGGTMIISHFILKRTYKKLEQLDVDSKRALMLIILSRIPILGCGIVTFVPIVLVVEAAMNGGMPGSVIGFYQTSYMTLYFSLFGIGSFLVLISPIVQLYRRTENRSLIFAGLLIFTSCSTIVYMANTQWDMSIFTLTNREFTSSYGTVMFLCGFCIFTSFWIVSRNAKSILRYQKLHFTMRLGE
tara:strand:+ start:1484 stop:2290 length:807 start_codon:yes stop_codon:yes gene_type:complete